MLNDGMKILLRPSQSLRRPGALKLDELGLKYKQSKSCLLVGKYWNSEPRFPQLCHHEILSSNMSGAWYSAWLTVRAQICITLVAKKQQRIRCSVSELGIKSGEIRRTGGETETPVCLGF